jgi:hypothetical protein
LKKTSKLYLEDAKQAYLDKIRKDEQKVKEAIITEANVLDISVVDDGTKRDSLTSYFVKPFVMPISTKKSRKSKS